MKLALQEAWKYQFHTYPNPAVGACIVKDGQVISVEAHKEAGMPHAEVEALKSAFIYIYPNSELKDITNSTKIHQYLLSNHNGCFKQCEIYVTLEPCNHTGKTPPCASLLEQISIKKVYIGSLDPNYKASGGAKRLQNTNIEVQTGVDTKYTDELLKPFKLWNQDKFIFFKLAMRVNGTVDGGYITTKDSLLKVHQFRQKIDLLLIGGNTVRTDRPTLDTRFINGTKAPNIAIYSKQQKLDKTIPLFNVKNRDVVVVNSLDILQKQNFVMIEGGLDLFDSIKQYIDSLVLFISHKDKPNTKCNVDRFGMAVVYSYFINEYDEILFLYNTKDTLH
jgi:diaminohydroxyphosphoribosylaminopyrimidine deaminase/5-amino-6-(5-phosphoribosylamino)uracil reductase